MEKKIIKQILPKATIQQVLREPQEPPEEKVFYKDRLIERPEEITDGDARAFDKHAAQQLLPVAKEPNFGTPPQEKYYRLNEFGIAEQYEQPSFPVKTQALDIVKRNSTNQFKLPHNKND